LKKLLTALSLFICLSVSAQHYTEFFNDGWKPERIWTKKTLKPPTGILSSFDPADVSIVINSADGLVYVSNGVTWNKVGLDVETDPTVSSYIKTITSAFFDHGETAYEWGNHATAGYLTSFTEVDPTVSDLIKAIPVSSDATTTKYYSWNNGSIDRAEIPYSVITGTPDLSVYELFSNKSTSTSLGTSNTLYPSQNAVKVYADTKQSALSGTGYSKWSSTTPSYLTSTQVTADLNVFSSSLKGLVPASGGGSANFMRADGAWAPPSGGSSSLTDTRIAFGSSSNTITSSADFRYSTGEEVFELGFSGDNVFFISPAWISIKSLNIEFPNISGATEAGYVLTNVNGDGIATWEEPVGGGAQSLQDVTNVGSSTTNDIFGTGFISESNGFKFNINNSGQAYYDGHAGNIGFENSSGTMYFQNSADSVASGTYPSYGIIQMAIKSNGSINFGGYGSGSITGTPTYGIGVDGSGNLIEIDVGGSTPSLQAVTDIGDLTTNPITSSSSVSAYHDGSGAYGVYATLISTSSSGGLILQNTDGWTGLFKAGALTGSFEYNVPNASGTLALTSDIASYTVDNGLTLTSGNIQWGGALTGDTYIPTSGHSLAIQGSGSNITYLDNGVIGITSNDGSIPLEVNSYASGFPVVASFKTLKASTNSIEDIALFSRQTTGTAADGIGVGIAFDAQLASGANGYNTNLLRSKWTDATDATRTSQFEIWGTDNTTMARKLAITGAGALILDGYNSLTTYADEAAAVTGGLPQNTVYKTSTGELRIKL
jgi:hypothetical protein